MSEMPNVSVYMARADFDAVPQLALPAGYHFRTYRPGDDLIWTELHRDADPFSDIGDDLFENQFGAQRHTLPSRMFYVDTDDGDTVASISAWWEHGPETAGDRGRIHWVVVRTDHQRRGLSKPMMTHAMNRLAQDHPSAMLDTATGRPWAIKVYLDFGFYPEPTDLADPERRAAWQALQGKLHHPLLASHLQRPAE